MGNFCCHKKRKVCRKSLNVIIAVLICNVFSFYNQNLKYYNQGSNLIRRFKSNINAEPLLTLAGSLSLAERQALSAMNTFMQINTGIDITDEISKSPGIAKLFSEYFEAKFLNPELAAAKEALLVDMIRQQGDSKESLLTLLQLYKTLVATNCYSPFYSESVAPALLFDGSQFSEEMKKASLVAFMPDETGSFGIVIFSENEDMPWQNINSAGGMRVVLMSQNFDLSKIWEHDCNLAEAMRSKNIWSGLENGGIAWAGVKLCLALAPNITKEMPSYEQVKVDILKRVLQSAVGVGLFTWYVGGPDVGIMPNDILESVTAIQERYLDYMELELSLVESLISGQLEGIAINDLKDGQESEFILKSGYICKVSNSLLKNAYDLYMDSGIAAPTLQELAALGQSSERKSLYLYDENDLAYKQWVQIVGMIENVIGLQFPGSERLMFSAIRERVLQGIRDGDILDHAGIFDENATKADLYRIMGVLIGGGPSTNGTFANSDKLNGITGRLTTRGLNRVADYLRSADKLPEAEVYCPTVVIRGAGDVGSAAAIAAVKDGYRVVGISNVKQFAYCEDGFTLDQLERLRGDRSDNSITNLFLGVSGIQIFNDPEQVYNVDADFLIPAAIGPTVTLDNVNLFKHFKAIVCGENNPFKKSDEAEVIRQLHEAGVIAIGGWLVNFGMVYSVWEETLYKHRYTVEELLEPSVWNAALDMIEQNSNSMIDQLLPMVLAKSENSGLPVISVANDFVRDVEETMVSIYFDTSAENEARVNEIIIRLRSSGYKMTYTQARRIAALELSRKLVCLRYLEQESIASTD